MIPDNQQNEKASHSTEGDSDKTTDTSSDTSDTDDDDEGQVGIPRSMNKGIFFLKNHYIYLNSCNVVEHHADDNNEANINVKANDNDKASNDDKADDDNNDNKADNDNNDNKADDDDEGIYIYFTIIIKTYVMQLMQLNTMPLPRLAKMRRLAPMIVRFYSFNT